MIYNSGFPDHIIEETNGKNLQSHSPSTPFFPLALHPVWKILLIAVHDVVIGGAFSVHQFLAKETVRNML